MDDSLQADPVATLLDMLGPLVQQVPPHDRFVVIGRCAEAVAFATDQPSHNPGQRARSAAHLLLELSCPDLPQSLVEDLACLCERATLSNPA